MEESVRPCEEIEGEIAEFATEVRCFAGLVVTVVRMGRQGRMRGGCTPLPRNGRWMPGVE